MIPRHTLDVHTGRACPTARVVGVGSVCLFFSFFFLVYTVHAPDLSSISCLIPGRSGRWFWTGAFLGFWGDGGGVDIRSIVDFMFGGGGEPSGGQY